MRSSQVYQPTTTNLPYNQDKAWVSSFLHRTDGQDRLRTVFVVFGIFFLLLGIIFITKGAIDYGSLQSNVQVGSQSSYIIFITLGVIFEIVALVMIIMYSRFVYYDPLCSGFCFGDKISKIRRDFQIGRSRKRQFNGQPLSAQYSPPTAPSVESPSPPTYTDTSEQQMLMSDRDEPVFDEDPRIVLSPGKSQDEC